MTNNSDKLDLNQKIQKEIIALERDKPLERKELDNYSIKLNPKSKILPFVKKISRLLSQSFLQDEAYFCRSDMIEDVSKIIFPPRDYDNLIRKVKGILDKKDIGALLFAAKICEEENKGKGENKLEKIKLKSAFNQRGITLYNWLRSGDVFPEDILPLLSSKKSFNNEQAFLTFFRNYFEDLLSFHPNRIFVSLNMTKEELKTEINRRACFYDSKNIIIYSRSGRNKISEDLLKGIIILFLGIKFKIKKKIYPLGNSSAIKFELIRLDKNPKKDKSYSINRKLKSRGIKERKRFFQEQEKKFQKEVENKKMKGILGLFTKN